eukprot:1469832-Rhodomonas_salina.1
MSAEVAQGDGVCGELAAGSSDEREEGEVLLAVHVVVGAILVVDSVSAPFFPAPALSHERMDNGHIADDVGGAISPQGKEDVGVFQRSVKSWTGRGRSDGFTEASTSAKRAASAQMFCTLLCTRFEVPKRLGCGDPSGRRGLDV